MKIKVICIGKTKRGYLDQGIKEYISRLGYYTCFDWVEIRPSHKSKEPLCEEAKKIRSRIHPQALRIVLTDGGKDFSSQDFARWFEKEMIKGIQEVDFIIGGDLGLDSSIISEADMCLSLSRMTFTHQMVRLILLEQLYRAFTIIRGEPYHHE